MDAKKLFFKECHLAGAKYYDLDEVFDYLRVGSQLKLIREKNNPHDENAVQVAFNKDGEDYLIGYIPRTDNEALAALLEMGWDRVFRCTICRINPEAYYESQIHLKISIVKNNELLLAQ